MDNLGTIIFAVSEKKLINFPIWYNNKQYPAMAAIFDFWFAQKSSQDHLLQLKF